MKTILLILFGLFFFNCFSQNYNDSIYLKNGSSFSCRIKEVGDKQIIFYYLNENNKELLDFVQKSTVEKYYMQAKTVSLTYKPLLENNKNVDNTTLSISDDLDNRLRNAGNHMIKFTRQTYIGVGLIVGGVLISYIGGIAAAISQSNNNSYMVIVAGTLSIFSGIGVTLVSIKHIGKAGRFLIGVDEKGITASLVF